MSKSNIIGYVVSFVSQPIDSKGNAADIFLQDIYARITEYNASLNNSKKSFKTINVHCYNEPVRDISDNTLSCDVFLETSKKTKYKFYTMVKGYKNLLSAVPNEWEYIKADIFPVNEDCKNKMNSIGEKVVDYRG